MQILIVEDERLIAEDLQEILYGLGYQAPSIAASAEAALELIAARRPDLVLMDIHLPGPIDGVTATERIRARYELPVIYLTAYADPDTVRRAATTEPLGYVLKPFDEHELRICLELAFAKHQAEVTRRHRHTALELNNRRLAEALAALEHHRAEIDTLSGLGGDLLRCETIPEAYAIIVGAARRLFPESAGALYILRDGQTQLEAVAVWGDYAALPPGALGPLAPGPVRLAVRASPSPDCRCPVPECARNYLCIPLVVEQALLGMLRIRANLAPAVASAEQLATALAEQAALGLANVGMRERLREEALRDSLTGLFNRRYMEETLVRELSRAARGQYPIGVILFDLDHFKRINDTYGHAAGDALLCTVGRCLLQAIRTEDIACRYGGEEFVIILPSVSLAVAVARAEQIRERVGSMRVCHEQQELYGVTVSAGVALIEDIGTTVAQALARADAALYCAKRSGRNRVVST